MLTYLKRSKQALARRLGWAALLTTIGVRAAVIAPAVPNLARPLPLTAVRLTGGPLKRAQDVDAQYLLTLERERMLAGFRLRAGLPSKAEGYGGWDAVKGKQLTGHIAGHYLSAVSLMFAATGDERFKQRADDLVRGLKEAQEANRDGYLGALDGGREKFAELAAGKILSGSFDLNGLWSPWYVQHKIFAGLRDAYRYTGNATALELEVKFAGWAESVLAKLDAAQLQQMLNTEFGGMNEVLAELYADTGDARWLALSHRFDHHAVIDALARGEDNLAGLHGNTQVPKLYGALVRYAIAGDAQDGAAARFFWERVALHHSFATGGHGKDEYFGAAERLSERTDGRTAETCNVYNMLKFTRTLFALQPDVRYAEFHERALFNHILASLDERNGRMCYMVPVGQGVQHEYQDMQADFTCCVGTGMESHARHGDGIYYESGNKLWVNLYAPSTAEWRTAGVTITMQTDFPEGELAAMKLNLAAPREFTLALRRPAWAGEGFQVRVNGELVHSVSGPASYVELKRRWLDGDRVELILPKALHLEPASGSPRRAAIMWGPLVLAGDEGSDEMAATRRWEPDAEPVLVAAERQVAEWVKPVPGKPGEFFTVGVGRGHDVELAPFYRLHGRVYTAYWDVLTPAEWEVKAAESAAEKARQRQLDRATIALVQPGEKLSEDKFHAQMPEDSGPLRVAGRPGRMGRTWFTFDLPVENAHPLALVATYHNGEHRRPRSFEIQIDGRRLARQEVKQQSPARFFDATYPIPAELVAGKTTVTVRFQAESGAEIAAVFGLRVIRAESMP